MSSRSTFWTTFPYTCYLYAVFSYNNIIDEFYASINIARIVKRASKSTMVSDGSSTTSKNDTRQGATGRALPDATTEWSRVDLDYSNILFSAESTPHRVPIGPRRPTVLQVIVALGWSRRTLPTFIPPCYSILGWDGRREPGRRQRPRPTSRVQRALIISRWNKNKGTREDIVDKGERNSTIGEKRSKKYKRVKRYSEFVKRTLDKRERKKERE